MHSFFKFSLIGLVSLSSVTSTVMAAEAGSFFGSLDLRPEWRAAKDKEDTFGSDNSISLGYQLSEDVGLSYSQNFMTDFTESTTQSSRIYAADGFLKGSFSPLYTNDTGYSVSYAPRVYVPTHAPKRDAGMITIVRNYFNFSKTVNNDLTLTASVIPMVHVYDAAGKIIDGQAVANPGFEQRLYLIASIKLSERLNLDLPVFYHVTKYRDFDASAKNNNQWKHLIYTWPELIYSLNDKSGIGLAAYTGNMLDDGDAEGGAFLNAIENTVVQFVFKTSI